MLTSSVSGEGLFSETTPPEPGLIPGTLATCPAECTPRPRNLPTYRAACIAAEGATVYELSAYQVVPGEIVWHCGRFLDVRGAKRRRVADIADVPSTEETREAFYTELRLEGPVSAGWLLANLDTPVYCLGR